MTIAPLTATPAPTVTADPATGTVEQRAGLAQGLIALATLIMTNPAVPIISFSAPHQELTYWVRGTAKEMIAEVDRVAAILGRLAGYSNCGSMYEVKVDFGLVCYRAVGLLFQATPEAVAA